MSVWETTSSFSSVAPASGVNSPVVENGNRLVKPTNNALHASYSFFMKITANGGSNAFFGPYVMKVGCTTSSVQTSDSPSFIIDQPVYVGDSPTNVFRYFEPVFTVGWCTISNNQVLNLDGTLWTVNPRISCSPQPCTMFSLDNTNLPAIIQFKFKSTYTNGLSHITASSKITLACGPSYTFSEVTAPINPQYVPHADSNVGFELPDYVSSQNAGCPPINWEVSSSSSTLIVHTDLN